MGKIVAMVGGSAVAQAGVERMLQSSGYCVGLFPSVEGFLAGRWSIPADCVLLDLSAVGREGLTLLRTLARYDVPLPVVVTGEPGDVPLAVEAMKLGASDFLEKPCRATTLVLAIGEAYEQRVEWQRRAEVERRAAARVERLPRRLRQVLRGMAQGRPSKVIAYELGLSPRTVESYRAQLLTRLGVRTTGAAIQIAVVAGLHTGPDAERSTGFA